MLSVNSSRIGILFCLLVFGSCIEGRPTENTIDSVLNGAAEIFFNIYDPVANYTKDFINDNTINSALNRTAETFYTIYDPLANHTKDFFGSISNSTNNETILGIDRGIVIDEVLVVNIVFN